MAEYQDEIHRRQVSIGFGSLLNSMLLCNNFNPEDNVALGQCVRAVGKRVKTTYMRKLCTYLAKSDFNRLEWLQARLDEIEKDATVLSFLEWSRTGSVKSLVSS